MIFVVDSLQILLDQLRIDLRGGNVAVAEHLLDRAKICTVFEQMRREAVAERMRRDILFDMRFFLIILDDLPEALTAHAFAGYVDKERMLGRNGDHFGPDGLYVFMQRLQRLGIDRDDAYLFSAFAADKAPGKTDIIDVQPDQFADPDAGRVQNLKHSLVPAALHFRNLGLLQKKLDLFSGQNLRKLLLGLVDLDVLNGVFFYPMS